MIATRHARLGLVLLSASLVCLVARLCAEQPGPLAPASFLDARLAELRRAKLTWDLRPGPPRRVADVVVLVPDVPTFLEAIAFWDEKVAFPILIDDAETVLKFVRAFGPARVVRYPRKAAPIPADQLWGRAIRAVGKAWSDKDAAAPYGDRWPVWLTNAPPGIVLAEPEGPALAGAVALAAGRFQPLARLDVDYHFNDTLDANEAARFATRVEATIQRVAARYRHLGDECDFLTLAGDWPYRYQQDLGTQRGPACLDDLVGRDLGTLQRWAYVGRLTGGPVQSLYQAMCALFLQPERATLFNSYGRKGAPWDEYDPAGARTHLDPLIRIAAFVDDSQADLTGWHKTFDPVNRSGLLLINSSGNPDTFNLARGQTGQTADVPVSVPCAVHFIHSHSADAPAGPGTIAARWLDQGAFIYYGAMNEPYLNAFRPPRLIAELLAAGLPFVAAVRATPRELFGHPWRLIYLGDPLFRLLPEPQRRLRIAPRLPDDWPRYEEAPMPRDGDDSARLAWALATAIARADRHEARLASVPELRDVLRAIDHARLPVPHRLTCDALLADELFQNNDLEGVLAAFGQRSAEDATPAVRRWLETARVALLQRHLTAKSWAQAVALWDDLMRAPSSDGLRVQVTLRLGALADASGQLVSWLDHLERFSRERPDFALALDEMARIRGRLRQLP